jgi:hypothetical protein
MEMGFGDLFKKVTGKERRRRLGYERCAMCNHSEMYHSVICQVCKCKRFAPSGRVGMNP